MERPKFTRLRYARTRDIDLLQSYLELLGVRVQIYGAPVFDGSKWVLWFVPNDLGNDIPSIDLDS